MNRGKIRLLEVAGSPFDMGLTHGQTYRDEIRHYAKERVSLVAGGKWSGHQLTTQQVLDVAEACLPAHRAYSPDLVEELEGMAKATSLSLPELLVVSGFTDFVDTVYSYYRQPMVEASRLPIDDCTAFIVPDSAANGAGFFGQTWDMHDSATEFVIMLRTKQEDSLSSLVFTTTGCIGQIGMNEAGIAIGINNLLGADGQVGVMWPFVVRKALQQDNIDDALACITEAPLAGAHNYLLFDAEGNGYNIEAMSTVNHITPLNGESIVHTNHCLIPETDAVAQTRPADSLASSSKRLDRGYELLQDTPITPEKLQALTRDSEAICVQSKDPYHIESCGAAIMRPKTREMWAVWGLPSENEYERFDV